jgi:hypothetical protein
MKRKRNMEKQNLPETANDSVDLPFELPNDFEEVLKELPEEKRKIVIRRYSQSLTMGVMRSEKSADEILASKMTPDHINTVVKDAGENMRLSYKDKSQTRLFAFGVIIIAAILFGVVIFAFQNNPEFVERVIFVIGGAIMGFAGGFGLGKSKKDE